MINDPYKYTNLKLATQSALLGEVVSSLRGVAVDWNNNTILIFLYNDGKISKELENDYSCIGTEVVANYSDADIDERVIRLDFPNKLPDHKHWVFRRKEPYV